MRLHSFGMAWLKSDLVGGEALPQSSSRLHSPTLPRSPTFFFSNPQRARYAYQTPLSIANRVLGLVSPLLTLEHIFFLLSHRIAPMAHCFGGLPRCSATNSRRQQKWDNGTG
jgi:hypothetical protein